MSAIAAPPPAPPRSPAPPASSASPAPPAPFPSPAPPVSPTPRDPQRRGGTVVFRVPLRSTLSAADLARLARLLDLATHMPPKMRPDPTSPGLARLDDYSGLFLERGAEDGCWVLEARTWGRPPADTVRGWQVIATQAARVLDPAVPLPTRPGILR
ncbi:MAG TPA: hypothetical protein VFN87_14405 [Solirubrobacteraceae bacterium]|nr:hypothetical protein [Solirubrobacteraceae bacterium]